ncbi:MAG: hypothetical protein J5769_01100 [Bacteroidales bacterium]|nr:hypothetical protein [Bacteroidales bacterium]
MKKLIVIVALMLGIAVAASAQPRALGVRGGYSTELSYQHSLGENFLEFDLGWDAYYSGINIAAAYDFSIMPLGPFNLYAGPAADLYTWDYYDAAKDAHLMRLGLGIGAQVGLEYFFDAIPLQLSLDWRPMVTLIGGVGFGWHGIALGLRYAF